MSVVLEFSIHPGGFRLGQVLSGPVAMRYELERIVPTGSEVLPFVWVTGDDHEGFAETVRSSPVVESVSALDRIGNRGLYRFEWVETPTDLTAAIDEAGGSVIRARGDDEWVFQVRFADHERLSEFHDVVHDQGIPLRIERTFPLSEAEEGHDRFDLTADQERALRLALREGYFATPRESGLSELADELDITRQALSNRIRRGNEKVLRGVLPGVVDESDAPP